MTQCLLSQVTYNRRDQVLLDGQVRKTELTENGKFSLFAANGKRKRPNVRLAVANKKRNQLLPFQQTCPSMRECDRESLRGS
jgi:hypothetical protein